MKKHAVNLKHLFSKKNRKFKYGILIFLLTTLPIIVWALSTQTFDPNKRAVQLPATPPIYESCVAVNKVITVTDAYGTDGGTCHDIQTAINAVDGDGFTIVINRGDYNIQNTIYITNKSNLKIEGNVEGNPDEVWLSFNTSNGGGWGIKVENSSGSIERLHAEGITPNGLMSIQSSTNFNINRTYLFGTTSHTFEIQNSSDVSIANSEIKSSAGAIHIDNSQNITVAGNKIHNSAVALSTNNSSSVAIVDNLITANNSGGIRLGNVRGTEIDHNTIVYNTGSSPTVNIAGINTAPNVFSQNIVAFNTGVGIAKEANSDNFSSISYNDVYDNYAGYNYSGMTDQTGANGNIWADPLLELASGNYCLLSGSPAYYGSIIDRGYMGHAGPCTSASPSPIPKPGDVNGDRYVNIIDIGIIIDNYRILPIRDLRTDLNHDGVVNIVDIGIVINNYEL